MGDGNPNTHALGTYGLVEVQLAETVGLESDIGRVRLEQPQLIFCRCQPRAGNLQKLLRVEFWRWTEYLPCIR